MAEAPKLGADLMSENPDLELRLRQIEQSLQNKAAASTTTASVDGGIGAVSGLALVNGIETLSITWNDSTISDLLHYEVQIDTTAAFSDPTIFKTQNTNFQFVGADTANTYFVRVRVVSTGGVNGTFTGTLNTTTGQVETADIALLAVDTPQIQDNAATDFADTTIAGPLDITGVGVGGSADIPGASLTITIVNSNIFVRFAYDHDGGGVSGQRFITAVRDTTTLGTIELAASTTLAVTNKEFVIYDTPGPGTYVYKLQVSHSNGGTAGNLENISIYGQSSKK